MDKQKGKQMAIKFHSEDIKNKYERKAHKVIFFSMFLLLIPVAYIIVQFINGIISPFNIIPLAIIVMILVNAVRTTLKTKTDDKGLFYEENYGLSEEEKEKHKQEEEKKLEGESYSYIVSLSKKAKVIRWLATALLIVAGIVMFCIGPNIYSTKDYTSVNATVISQEGEYHTDTTYYENGGSSSTSYSRCVVEIKYSYNGEVKTDTIYINGIEYIYSEDFEILVDNNGKYVRTAVESTKFYIFAGLLIFAGILLGLSAYLKVSSIIFLGTAFLLVGGAILVFVCMPVAIKEVLFVHFGSIPFMFFIIAIYWFSCFLIPPMLLPKDLSSVAVMVNTVKVSSKGGNVYKEKRGNQFVISRKGQVDNNYQTNLNYKATKCDYCGGEVSAEENFCKHCGAKIKK